MPRSVILRLLCLAAVAAPLAAGAQWLRAGQPDRLDVRRAVADHRAEQREQIRADEAMAGRRLTAAERAQLREQLRSEWAARNEATQTAESGPAVSSGGSGQPAGSGWRVFWPWASNSRQ